MVPDMEIRQMNMTFDSHTGWTPCTVNEPRHLRIPQRRSASQPSDGERREAEAARLRAVAIERRDFITLRDDARRGCAASRAELARRGPLGQPLAD